uniref:DUF4203 domain-containing protein n=1 Tax=Acrobeloides nanus TaxID=290746 RepID=A0A914D9P4_9BILA
TGALIIGYLGLIFGIIGLLAAVAKGNGEGIVSNVLNVIIGGCIIYADKSHKPGGYLPYLILSVIGIVFYTVFIVIFVIMAIFLPETLSNYTQDYGYGTQHKDREVDPKTAMRVMLLIVAAVLAFADWIAIWFWMVVYRAYEHMKGVEEYDRGQNYQVKLNNV